MRNRVNMPYYDVRQKSVVESAQAIVYLYYK